MVDPARSLRPSSQPAGPRPRAADGEFHLALFFGNYSDLLGKFSFGTYVGNSVFITVAATLITLLINSMAAFALSANTPSPGATRCSS